MLVRIPAAAALRITSGRSKGTEICGAPLAGCRKTSGFPPDETSKPRTRPAVADGGGGERHQREVHGRRPSNRLSQWARIGGDLLAVDTLPGQVDEVAGRPGAGRIVADA